MLKLEWLRGQIFQYLYISPKVDISLTKILTILVLYDVFQFYFIVFAIVQIICWPFFKGVQVMLLTLLQHDRPCGTFRSPLSLKVYIFNMYRAHRKAPYLENSGNSCTPLAERHNINQIFSVYVFDLECDFYCFCMLKRFQGMWHMFGVIFDNLA